jgi:predicted nucleic acid-binding protein
MAMLREFHDSDVELVVCANTIVEVTHAKVDRPRLDWLLSQVRVEPVTKQSARTAAKILAEARLHGHEHAIDATVAETALRQITPAGMLTSDLDDMRKLCGRRIHLIRV